MNLTEKAKNELNKIGCFITSNNYNVIEVKEDYCKLDGLVTESSFNHVKTVHGGYIFGLADTAAGILACIDGRKAVTINADITYLKPAYGPKLTAVAKYLKKGKTILVLEVEISDSKEQLVAKSTITYFCIN